MTNIDEAFLAERERIHGAATGTWKADELMADAIVDALDHQPALIAEIRRLLEARKLHPEFERLEQKFDPRDPTPSWFVGGGA
jgi:hypothetical protein